MATLTRVDYGGYTVGRVVTIDDGQTESEAINIRKSTLIAIQTQSTYDGATITFKMSTNGLAGGNYRTYKFEGTNLTATVSGADFDGISEIKSAGLKGFVKVVSNTAQSGAEATVRLILKRKDG